MIKRKIEVSINMPSDGEKLKEYIEKLHFITDIFICGDILTILLNEDAQIYTYFIIDILQYKSKELIIFEFTDYECK